MRAVVTEKLKSQKKSLRLTEEINAWVRPQFLRYFVSPAHLSSTYSFLTSYLLLDPRS